MNTRDMNDAHSKSAESVTRDVKAATLNVIKEPPESFVIEYNVCQGLMFKAFPKNCPTIVGHIFVFVPLNQSDQGVRTVGMKVINGGETIDRLWTVSEEAIEQCSHIFLGLYMVNMSVSVVSRGNISKYPG